MNRAAKASLCHPLMSALERLIASDSGIGPTADYEFACHVLETAKAAAPRHLEDVCPAGHRLQYFPHFVRLLKGDAKVADIERKGILCSTDEITLDSWREAFRQSVEMSESHAVWETQGGTTPEQNEARFFSGL